MPRPSRARALGSGARPARERRLRPGGPPPATPRAPTPASTDEATAGPTRAAEATDVAPERQGPGPNDNGVSSWDCWGMPGPPPDARVLATDAEGNRHVISWGAEDGVRLGERLVVSRGDAYVAVLEITAVERSQAAGRVLEPLARSAVRRGDSVRRGR